VIFSAVKPQKKTMYVEVEPNPNCEASVFLRFREQGAARPVSQVRSYDRVSNGEWCWITGLQGEGTEGQCEAWARPVEDSGAGLVYLVWGGAWGLRLKAANNPEAWSFESRHQWGEAYLLLADARDIRFADEQSI
jgi:hypothetical protein